MNRTTKSRCALQENYKQKWFPPAGSVHQKVGKGCSPRERELTCANERQEADEFIKAQYGQVLREVTHTLASSFSAAAA